MQRRMNTFAGCDVIRYLGVAFVLVVALAPLAARTQSCPSRCNSCREGVANCTSRSLTAPPRTYPPSTRVIDLKDNHIRILGMRTFHRLPSLEILKVNHNKINSLRHLAFRTFPNVATIDLSENRINRISPRALRGKTSLTTLLLNRNRIQTVAGIFRGLTNLYQLNLAKNRIGRINEHDFSDQGRVSYLDLRDNRISFLHPKAFENMTRLRYLFLEGNPINRRLANLAFTSQVLQLVDFSNCRMPSVPKTFPASLSDFRLSNNRIMQVNFTDFTDITELQLLALNDNELHFFADGSLNHLNVLKEVWLRRNRLVYVPRDLPNSLERLHMDTNSIQEIEAGLFSAESRLESMTVENNQIRRLHPNTFAGMGHLKMLNFQGNHLQTLETDTFRDLPSLETLLLSNNPLQRISQGAFHNLARLNGLYMSYVSQNDFAIDYNFLTQMPALTTLEMMASPALAEALMELLDSLAPADLLVMEAVTTVDLSYNTLEYVSPRIRSVFPNVRTLPLDGNPFRCTQRLRWLKDWMLSSDVVLTRYEELTCDSPPNLYGRLVRSLEHGEWASDAADRSLEFRNAQVVNQHAAMARDMPGSRAVIRSSSHKETNNNNNNNGKDSGDWRSSAIMVDPRDSSSSLSGRTGDDADVPENLLRERANREERRKKKLRSKGRRRGKGKKNKRKGEEERKERTERKERKEGKEGKERTAQERRW